MTELTMYRPRFAFDVAIDPVALADESDFEIVETFVPRHRADEDHPAIPGPWGPAYYTRAVRREETWVFLDRYEPKHREES